MGQGPQGLVDLARTAPMMMPEFMDEWFENELLKSALSTAGIHGLSPMVHMLQQLDIIFYINIYILRGSYIIQVF